MFFIFQSTNLIYEIVDLSQNVVFTIIFNEEARQSEVGIGIIGYNLSVNQVIDIFQRQQGNTRHFIEFYLR